MQEIRCLKCHAVIATLVERSTVKSGTEITIICKNRIKVDGKNTKCLEKNTIVL